MRLAPSLLAVAFALALALLAGPVEAAATTDPRGASPSAPNPLAGERFFVDHRLPAWRHYVAYARAHRTRAAALMWRIAREPQFQWLGRWTRAPGARVRELIRRARARGAVPLVAVMRHQGTACSARYAGGGPAEDARTRGWYRRFARGVGAARIVIAFEPDSLGTVGCLARSRRMARLRLLRYGVGVLSRLPNATVYLEGGASDWDSARHTAWQLRYIGIRRVRGFMLNVTHYDWTADNIRHGLEISRLTGGKPFIVSTAMNGRGPVHYRRYYGPHLWRVINVWCNPLKRGLGPAPTTATANRKVDAYMWIGRPGESGGSCNGGPLPVGTFWPERALMFAANATSWLAQPVGTRFGYRAHLSLRQLGA